MGWRSDTAQRAAWAEFGRRHYRGITGGFFALKVLPFAAVGALIWLVGWAAHRAWTRLPEVEVPAMVVSTMPTWGWVGLGVCVAGLVWVLRPGRIPPGPGVRAAQAGTLLIAMAGITGCAVGVF